MEDRSPETRRRARVNAPTLTLFLWLAIAGAVIIGVVFTIVYWT